MKRINDQHQEALEQVEKAFIKHSTGKPLRYPSELGHSANLLGQSANQASQIFSAS